MSPSLPREAVHEADRLLPVLVEGEPHPEAELRVVLEERVRPGGAAAVAVLRVGGGGEVGAVDRRAAGGVRDQRRGRRRAASSA